MLACIFCFIIFDIIGLLVIFHRYISDCKEIKPENLEVSLKKRILLFCIAIILPQILAVLLSLGK